MVKIRLLEKGRKGQPFFLIVAIDSRRSSKSKKFIKKFGHYDPLEKDFNKKLKITSLDSINDFVLKGAQFSLTVKNILKKFSKLNK